MARNLLRSIKEKNKLQTYSQPSQSGWDEQHQHHRCHTVALNCGQRNRLRSETKHAFPCPPPSTVIILHVILISLIFLIILCSNLLFIAPFQLYFSNFVPTPEEAATPLPKAQGHAMPRSFVLTRSVQLHPPGTAEKACPPATPPSLSCISTQSDSHSCPGTHKTYRHLQGAGGSSRAVGTRPWWAHRVPLATSTISPPASPAPHARCAPTWDSVAN